MRDCVVFTKVTNDKQSRSSRGRRSIVGGDVAKGQKLIDASSLRVSLTPRIPLLIYSAEAKYGQGRDC